MTTGQTIYIGPTADDVRRILRAADIEPHMIRDGDQQRPVVELTEGLVTIPFAKLISEYVSVVMERDALALVADSHDTARDELRKVATLALEAMDHQRGAISVAAYMNIGERLRAILD